MFTLPPPTDGDAQITAEGTCDENPVVCHDTVEEFRALCWAIYAQPTEIVAQLDHETANVPRMILVLAMAHKYELGNMQEWVFDALQRIADVGNLLPCCKSWSNVQKLLNWLLNIKGRDKTRQLSAFISALEIAEQCGSDLRTFHGQAYYSHLKATGKFDLSPRNDSASTGIGSIFSFVADEPPPDLGESRRLRLYHGFWSLTQLRHRLDTAPPLDDNTQCNEHVTICQAGWTKWWKDFLYAVQKKKRIGDPGTLLLELQKRILVEPICSSPAAGEGSVAQVPCQAQIKTQVCAMKKQFDDTLADHFMIPVD
ncbi:hypothetical protein NP233_g9272 [Leucocoprinus birnbaumii]|uniref:Uncharacterized protein n=1 Tax=Leucocoprinus birnbaumii TaxID=56174 RepID=A0AAD5VL10_9AGAR|nr:hypothetical protein NP233_g9272 [Leucocoprinus birnbaumii]